MDTIAAQRARLTIRATQMLEATRSRIEEMSTPASVVPTHTPGRIDEHRAQRIARQRLRIGSVVTIGDELVGRAVPASQPAVLGCDPEVVVRVLCDIPDEVAGQ